MAKQMFCPRCNTWVDEPSIQSWGPEWVWFHTGHCPKCETQLCEQQPTPMLTEKDRGAKPVAESHKAQGVFS